MTRQIIGEGIAARLFAAEAAIDAALVEIAALAQALPGARADAYLAATAGQGVFDGVSASLSAATEARARLVDTHRGLASLSRKIGLDTLAVGPLDKPEDRPPTGPTKPGVTDDPSLLVVKVC